MTVHVVMQGKGGVGKSVVAMLLAQNRRSVGIEVECRDCDPINATLARFEGLGATALELLGPDGDIAPGVFDLLVEEILALEPGTDMVVDTGATTFVPLSRYIVTNELPRILEGEGHEMIVHVVVPGGAALGDSIVGLGTILQSIQGAQVVVWLNGYFGPFLGLDGKPIDVEEMQVFQDHADQVESVIELQEEPALFAADFRTMLSRKHLFAEVVDNEDYAFMSRQRLRILGERLMTQISQALGVPAAGLAADGEAGAEPNGAAAKAAAKTAKG